VFKAELSQRLSEIFEFPKTTFLAPSESYEQDVLFIEINECHSRITEGKAYAKVLGSLTVFSQLEKVPFGFFSKKIQQVSFLTKDFFFFDIDVNPASSPARLQNILERRVRFVYLYSAQYDPAQGSITSLEGI
jgi:hypothetical protein